MVIKKISDGHEAFEKVGGRIEKNFKFKTGFPSNYCSRFSILF